MKILSYFHLLFLCSLWTFSSFAQADFAPIGAEWYHDRTGTGGKYYGYTKSTSVKDSVIEGRTCRVINSMIVQKPRSSQSVDTMYQEASMIVYATPDTVYYLNHEIERFIPLYIFNVNQGDTISYRTPYTIPNHADFPPEDTIFRILITDVSTTDISGVPLKTVYYTALDMWGFSWGSNPEGYYKEKIGTVRTSLLSHAPIVTYTGAEHGPSLRCYNDEEISYPSGPKYRACDYIEGYTGIFNRPISNRFQIYPNPAADYVTIRHTVGNHPFISVDIYDMIGKKIKTIHLNNQSVTTTISVVDLAPSNYILRINTNDQFFYQKICVQ